MPSVVLLSDNLPGWAPGTRLYETSDGRWLAVEAAPIPTKKPGRQAIKTLPRPAVIFLCDQTGAPVDADENDYDPLTPLHRFPAGTTHEDALAQAGYSV